MTNLLKRLANLMSVKSLVTIALTIVFCIMAYKQTISQDFMTIYSVVIAFFSVLKVPRATTRNFKTT